MTAKICPFYHLMTVNESEGDMARAERAYSVQLALGSVNRTDSRGRRPVLAEVKCRSNTKNGLPGSQSSKTVQIGKLSSAVPYEIARYIAANGYIVKFGDLRALTSSFKSESGSSAEALMSKTY